MLPGFRDSVPTGTQFLHCRDLACFVDSLVLVVLSNEYIGKTDRSLAFELHGHAARLGKSMCRILQVAMDFKNSLIIHKPLTYQMVDKTSRAVVLKAVKPPPY